jgi:nucleoside-diphosphate-sugar epimerase
MKTLVTGSSGLLGQCHTELLVERGDSVRGFDMVPPAQKQRSSIEFVRGDMRDAAAIRDAARGVDVIYHLAAGQRMKPQFADLDEQEIYDMNLGGVANVLQVAQELGTPKVVFVSSSGIYGVPQTVPCTEDHPTEPLGAYGDSKLEAEQLCRRAIDAGLDVTALRPMSLFGPNMTGVFVILFEWVRTDRPVFTLGSGNNKVQMVSAWDVAGACIKAAERSPSEHFFNIGSDPETVPTVHQQVEALARHAGSRSRVIPIPAAVLRNVARALHPLGMSPIVPEHYLLADANFLLDISRAREQLDWEPTRTNNQLMAEAYDWYVEHGDHARKQHPALRALNAITGLLRL